MALSAHILRLSAHRFAQQLVGRSAHFNRTAKAITQAVTALPANEAGYVTMGQVNHLITNTPRPLKNHLISWTKDLQSIHDEDRHFQSYKDYTTFRTHEFSHVDQRRLRDALYDVSLGIYAQSRERVKSILELNLARSLRHQLRLFSEGLEPYGALHITGLPHGTVLNHILLGLGDLIGDCYQETSEMDDLVQIIEPKDDESKLQTSGSSAVNLYLHVENAATKNVPDWVGIACHRNHEQVETLIVRPVAVLNKMIEDGHYEVVARLWRSDFWAQAPTSFGEQSARTGLSVLSGYFELPRVMADFADIGAIDDVAVKAYKLFRQYCEQMMESLVLNPGEVILMRNTGPKPGEFHDQTMHGRRSFIPHPTQPRILGRVFVREFEPLQP